MSTRAPRTDLDQGCGVSAAQGEVDDAEHAGSASGQIAVLVEVTACLPFGQHVFRARDEPMGSGQRSDSPGGIGYRSIGSSVLVGADAAA